MFEKNGKYFADWRDADGTRTRKSFTSKRAAQRFEAEQRAAIHPKSKGVRKPSRPSSRHMSHAAVQNKEQSAAGSPRKQSSRNVAG